MESKPHERIDLLIAANMNVYQTKKRTKSISIVIKTCFSEEKLIKQFGNSPPPLLREPPAFSTNLPISEQLFHDPPFCPNFENTPPNFMGGEETMSA